MYFEAVRGREHEDREEMLESRWERGDERADVLCAINAVGMKLGTEISLSYGKYGDRSIAIAGTNEFILVFVLRWRKRGKCTYLPSPVWLRFASYLSSGAAIISYLCVCVCDTRMIHLLSLYMSNDIDSMFIHELQRSCSHCCYTCTRVQVCGSCMKILCQMRLGIVYRFV